MTKYKTEAVEHISVGSGSLHTCQSIWHLVIDGHHMDWKLRIPL